MTDLETRLAKARERLRDSETLRPTQAFDAAAAIAREVVAEKDAALQALEARKVNPNLRKKLAEGSIDIVDAQEMWGFEAASKIAFEVIEESYPDGTYQEVCAELYIRGVEIERLKEVVAEKDARIQELEVQLGIAPCAGDCNEGYGNTCGGGHTSGEHDCDNGFVCCEGCEHIGHRHPKTDEPIPERHAAFFGYALPICGEPKHRGV